MKKMNNKGFVLAETLVVTVFLMVLFTMIYQNFYPLIGEYEKRENYDDVDGKYVAYWIKRLVESSAYEVSSTKNGGKRQSMIDNQFIRFECSDISTVDQQRSVCINLVKALEIANCDRNGDGCEIYVTNYRLGYTGDPSRASFKKTVKNNITRSQEYKKNSASDSSDNNCRKENDYFGYCKCKNNYSKADPSTQLGIESECRGLSNQKVFTSSMQDYVETLPDYSTASLNASNFRVIIMVRHRKDGNNYYSFSTMEVRK